MKIFIIILFLISFSSCATPKMWVTDKDEDEIIVAYSGYTKEKNSQWKSDINKIVYDHCGNENYKTTTYKLRQEHRVGNIPVYQQSTTQSNYNIYDNQGNNYTVNGQTTNSGTWVNQTYNYTVSWHEQGFQCIKKPRTLTVKECLDGNFFDCFVKSIKFLEEKNEKEYEDYLMLSCTFFVEDLENHNIEKDLIPFGYSACIRYGLTNKQKIRDDHINTLKTYCVNDSYQYNYSICYELSCIFSKTNDIDNALFFLDKSLSIQKQKK